MSATTGMTEMIRIRIEPEKKAALTRLYQSRGMHISQVVRDFLDDELEAMGNPLDRFDAIMESADKKLGAYNGPEPTIDDIVAYVERVRSARVCDSVV